MGKKEYRLPTHPKRTKRPVSGQPEPFHKEDYTETERWKFASEQERKNRLIKERFDAHDERSCKPQKECTAALEKQRNRPLTCKKIKLCSWAIYLGLDSLV
jgi:hypothetical protein